MQFSHQQEKKERSGVNEEIEDDSLFPQKKNTTISLCLSKVVTFLHTRDLSAGQEVAMNE